MKLQGRPVVGWLVHLGKGVCTIIIYIYIYMKFSKDKYRTEQKTKRTWKTGHRKISGSYEKSISLILYTCSKHSLCTRTQIRFCLTLVPIDEWMPVFVKPTVCKHKPKHTVGCPPRTQQWFLPNVSKMQLSSGEDNKAQALVFFLKKNDDFNKPNRTEENMSVHFEVVIKKPRTKGVVKP